MICSMLLFSISSLLVPLNWPCCPIAIARKMPGEKCNKFNSLASSLVRKSPKISHSEKKARFNNESRAIAIFPDIKIYIENSKIFIKKRGDEWIASLLSLSLVTRAMVIDNAFYHLVLFPRLFRLVNGRAREKATRRNPVGKRTFYSLVWSIISIENILAEIRGFPKGFP